MAENVLEPMTDITAKIKAEQILSKIKRNPNSQSEKQTKPKQKQQDKYRLPSNEQQLRYLHNSNHGAQTRSMLSCHQHNKEKMTNANLQFYTWLKCALSTIFNLAKTYSSESTKHMDST